MMANIVAMFHSTLHMDDGYVNHIAIVQDVDGYHNHFLYDEDKGKGAAGTGPFKTIEDCFMAAHIKVEYLPEEGGEQDE